MASRQDYRRGAESLLDHLSQEYDSAGTSKSASGNVQFYYKIPSVFAIGGRRALATRTLETFAAKFLPSGRLDLAGDPVADPWAAYLAGWAAWGSGQLGRFDLARAIMDGVLGRQNKKYGGFEHPASLGSIQDTERSSAAAMGCIWAMHLPAAERVAGFLQSVLEHQPDHDTFYAYLDASGRIVRDRDDRNAYFDLDDPNARPALFATSVACLVWLGRATGERRHFNLAHRYLKFVMSHRHDAPRLPLATKTGWSALLLASHISDEKLAEFAHRSGEAILDRLNADGSIDFTDVPDVPQPVDKVWQIGWGCDCLLTLQALADGGA